MVSHSAIVALRGQSYALTTRLDDLENELGANALMLARETRQIETINGARRDSIDPPVPLGPSAARPVPLERPRSFFGRLEDSLLSSVAL